MNWKLRSTLSRLARFAEAADDPAAPAWCQRYLCALVRAALWNVVAVHVWLDGRDGEVTPDYADRWTERMDELLEALYVHGLDLIQDDRSLNAQFDVDADPDRGSLVNIPKEVRKETGWRDPRRWRVMRSGLLVFNDLQLPVEELRTLGTALRELVFSEFHDTVVVKLPDFAAEASLDELATLRALKRLEEKGVVRIQFANDGRLAVQILTRRDVNRDESLLN